MFQAFQDFQKLVEIKLNRKIISMQSDWGVGVSTKSWTHSFNALASLIVFPVPMLTKKMVQLKGNIDILWKLALLS